MRANQLHLFLDVGNSCVPLSGPPPPFCSTNSTLVLVNGLTDIKILWTRLRPILKSLVVVVLPRGTSDQSHTTNGKSTKWLRSQARKMVVAPFKELNPNAPECPQTVGLSALQKGCANPLLRSVPSQ